MNTEKLSQERALLSHEECCYRSEELFFYTINQYFPTIDHSLRVVLHETSVASIRNYIIELGCLDEEALKEYAQVCIGRDYERLCELRGIS